MEIDDLQKQIWQAETNIARETNEIKHGGGYHHIAKLKIWQSVLEELLAEYNAKINLGNDISTRH